MEAIEAPDFAKTYVNLADADFGAKVLSCSDDWFAPADRMLQSGPAIFIPGKYDDHGKWMDGWESRRRRTLQFPAQQHTDEPAGCGRRH